MKAVCLIGAIAFGLMAIFAMGISAIVCAVLASGLLISAAVYAGHSQNNADNAETKDRVLNKRGWKGLPDWVA